MEETRTLGDELAAIASRVGVTYVTLAERMGSTTKPPTAWRWLNGKSRPEASTLDRILVELGASPEECRKVWVAFGVPSDALREADDLPPEPGDDVAAK